MAKAKVKSAEPEVAEVVEASGDTPEITRVIVDHGDVTAIYRTVSTNGEGCLNVCFADGTGEHHHCDDKSWQAFEADESDWSVKAKKFYDSL